MFETLNQIRKPPLYPTAALRSGYLPKLLGVLLIVSGAGFFMRGVTYIVAPHYSSVAMLYPMALAGIPLTFWLLLKGVDRKALVAL